MISDQYNLKQFAPLFLNKISVSVGLRQSKQSLLQICVPVVVKINTISYVICHFLLSRSMRSAWIEIPTGGATRSALWGRAPCGARGLKCHRHRRQTVARSRAPCGARGLKYQPNLVVSDAAASRSMRSAWIEINSPVESPLKISSRSMRSAWIEMRPSRASSPKG